MCACVPVFILVNLGKWFVLLYWSERRIQTTALVFVGCGDAARKDNAIVREIRKKRATSGGIRERPGPSKVKKLNSTLYSVCVCVFVCLCVCLFVCVCVCVV